ncbi:MAG: TraB/GumN family protein [Gammaproteobacteria bacterium]|nr:TraB/GumN family protein [Gammaproteobacteria bacterium]
MYKYLLVLFLFPSLCFSQTSLWHISKNGNYLYLGGTIHMLKKEDYPLPIEFSQAFKKSDTLVFETDIEKAKAPEFAQKMANMMSLPAGQSLKTALNKNTFDKLKTHLAERGIPIESLLSFKPSMVVLVISVIELKKMGMVDIGVDEYFHRQAKKAGKSIAYFESVDEQLSFLSAMGAGNENDMILNTLKDLSRMKTMMTAMKSAWLKGDENKLAEVSLTEMIRDYPDLYQTLLVKRNNNWMPHVEKMMRDKKVELVLVGALHLVGKDGLLQQLRDKGYRVTPFR